MLNFLKIPTIAVVSMIAVGCASNGSIGSKMSNASDAVGVEVFNPHVRETPPTANMTAAYMQIKNSNDYPVQIFAGSSNKHAIVEVHDVIMEGNMHRMVKQEYVRINPGDTLTMKPGSYHMMLINPTSKENLQVGDTVELTLFFQNPDSEEVYKKVLDAPVKKVETMMKKGMMHHHH